VEHLRTTQVAVAALVGVGMAHTLMLALVVMAAAVTVFDTT
jgi:hypothetical protein